MDLAAVRELFAYNAWANRQSFAALERVSADSYFRDLKSSLGGLHVPLCHVVAALEVFVERGCAAAKLADVARRAGVTKGTLYLYFDSKEALFKAVVRETIVPVIAQGEALARSFTGSARELLERLVREYWRLVGETALAGIPKLMMAEAATFPELTRFYYDEVVTRGHRLMAGVIERGVKNGE